MSFILLIVTITELVLQYFKKKKTAKHSFSCSIIFDFIYKYLLAKRHEHMGLLMYVVKRGQQQNRVHEQAAHLSNAKFLNGSEYKTISLLMLICAKHKQELRFAVYLRVALDKNSGSLIKRGGGHPKGTTNKL